MRQSLCRQRHRRSLHHDSRQFNGGSIVPLNVAVELASPTVADPTVIGERGGPLRAADKKRRSVTLSDVVLADEIGLLPIKTMPKRCSGCPACTWRNMTRVGDRTVSIRVVARNLNNVRLNSQPMASTERDRASALDQLPASIVANIEVVKAVTPDTDANTIGGTVNRCTLTAFDRSNRSL